MASTARSQTRREKVEAREQAILCAARQVFEREGFEGARLVEVGRLSGVSEATVYTYYKNKAALMEAVLADFWDVLTRDARAAVSGIADPLEQLNTLAEFHLREIIRNIRFLSLFGKLNGADGRGDTQVETTRAYVRIFDEIFQRCVDREIFANCPPVWIPRDVFFGTLEYSARTAVLREIDHPSGVVENLIGMFTATYGRETKRASDDQAGLIERLERAVKRLEGTG